MCLPSKEKSNEQKAKIILARNNVPSAHQEKKRMRERALKVKKSKILFACFNKQWKWTGCCLVCFFFSLVGAFTRSLIPVMYVRCDMCVHTSDDYDDDDHHLQCCSTVCILPILNFSFYKVHISTLFLRCRCFVIVIRISIYKYAPNFSFIQSFSLRYTQHRSHKRCEAKKKKSRIHI